MDDDAPTEGVPAEAAQPAERVKKQRGMSGAPKHDGYYSETACKICNRANADDIHVDLAAGKSVRSVAIHYGLQYEALRTHWRDHVLTDKYQQGIMVINVAQIKDIPLWLKERRDRIEAYLYRLEAPLRRPDGKGSGIKAAQWSAIIRLLQVLAEDERTMLKIVGLLKDEGSAGHQQFMLSPQYAALMNAINEKIDVLAQGDSVRAARVRQELAEELYPMSELTGGDPALKYLEWSGGNDNDG